jgi:outer membrane protein assembly factor BamB
MLLGIALLTACSSLPWGGSDEPEEIPLPGERQTILPPQQSLPLDASLKGKVTVAPVQQVVVWPQLGANPGYILPHAHMESKAATVSTAPAGDGKGWEGAFSIPPVVGQQAVYAMDAEGNVSAHRITDIRERLWKADLAKDDLPPGGGLALAGRVLFVALSDGHLFALHAETGAVLWQQALNLPIRSAPRIYRDRLYLLTANQELLALNAAKGELLWKHQGLQPSASMTGGGVPALTPDGKRLVQAYASGEIIAFSALTGEEVWRDRLGNPQSASLTPGITAHPVLAGNVLFVPSTQNSMAAWDALTGTRIWEQPISSTQPPFIAGDWGFALTADQQLAAFATGSGKLAWAVPVTTSESQPWYGPMLVDNQLWLIGAKGVLQKRTPLDGALIEETPLPEGIYHAPIVAGGAFYAVTRQAELVRIP